MSAHIPTPVKAHLIGGGIASLAAAAILIRDGDMRGIDITIYEELPHLGGSLDGTGNAQQGYIVRGGRMLESKYVCTYDLFEVFRANFRLISTYGLMAIFDGGLLQFVELSFWGYLGLVCYLVFKGCLDGLLSRVPRPAGDAIAERGDSAEASPRPSTD